MTRLRIGELAKRSGLSVETLRYYERRGLIPPPERLASGYRREGSLSDCPILEYLHQPESSDHS